MHDSSARVTFTYPQGPHGSFPGAAASSCPSLLLRASSSQPAPHEKRSNQHTAGDLDHFILRDSPVPCQLSNWDPLVFLPRLRRPGSSSHSQGNLFQLSQPSFCRLRLQLTTREPSTEAVAPMPDRRNGHPNAL